MGMQAPGLGTVKPMMVNVDGSVSVSPTKSAPKTPMFLTSVV